MFPLTRFVLPSLRQVVKHRVFIIMNLLGLSVGLTTSLLLIQYTQYEFSYDRFHSKSDRIYRIRYDNIRDGRTEISSAAAVPAVGKAMYENFDEVEDYAWAYPVYNGYFTAANRGRHENKIYIVTPGFLRIFDWEILRGNSSALSSPRTAVLTRSTALRYFGTIDVLGEKIFYEDGTEYTVTGIIGDVPANSHIKFPMLVSADVMYDIINSNPDEAWTWYDFHTYILTGKGVDPAEFEKSFDDWLSLELADFWEKDKRRQYFKLQSIKKIHLYSDLMQESEPEEQGNSTVVLILLFVAISVLIIAWINYVNLTSSIVWSRTKEVGLRMVLGATKRNIYILFIGEGLIIHILAAGLSLVLIELSLPAFSKLLGHELTMSLMGDPRFWFIMLFLLVSGAVISGIYPSINMTRHRPVELIDSLPVKFRSGYTIRRILVMAQYIVSIGFISSAYFATTQVYYLQNLNMGVDINKTLVIWGPGLLENNDYESSYRSFQTSLKTVREVKSITTSNNVPGKEVFLSEKLRKPDEPVGRIVYNISMDEEYIPSFNLEIVAGRNFNPLTDRPGRSIILNHSATQLLGFRDPEKIIGTSVYMYERELEVVGVIRDYHQMSQKIQPRPLAYHYQPLGRTYLALKVSSQDMDSTIACIEKCWMEAFPGNPFDFFFLDRLYKQQYRLENQISSSLIVFAVLAMFIAMLGLFGLASYVSVQRAKEISIRKVFGAETTMIIGSLVKDYLGLILLSILISTPLTWFVVHTWLESYPSRINIGIQVFLLAGFSVLLVSLIAVVIQTVRTAAINPAESLKHRS